MAEYIHLIGAEDVCRAGNAMRGAADEMQRAAANIDAALERHQRFLDEWLSRFTEAMQIASPAIARSAVGEVSLSIADRVRKIIAGLLIHPNEGDVKDEASFIDDLGADSLNLVEIVVAMESEFDIEIPDNHAETLLTVGDAIRYVEKVVSRG